MPRSTDNAISYCRLAIAVLALLASCGSDPVARSNALEADSLALLERWAEVAEAVQAGGSVAIAVEQIDQIQERMRGLAASMKALDQQSLTRRRQRQEVARRELAERIGRALLAMDSAKALALVSRGRPTPR